MHSSRVATIAAGAAGALSLAVLGCSSTSDHRLRVDSWPRGATVRVGEEGRVEGQTPIEALHLVVPDGGTVRLVVEKDGFQTVGCLLDEESEGTLFFPLQVAPETERILGAIKALQATVENLGAAVNALRAELERSRK